MSVKRGLFGREMVMMGFGLFVVVWIGKVKLWIDFVRLLCVMD